MKRFEVAAIVGGLALAALLGCGREPSVAEKSAAAFREAQKKGETFGGDGHAHGHGAVSPGGEQAAPDADPHAGHGGQPPAGHDHGAAEAPGAGEEHARHGTAGAERRADQGAHDDHAAMGHGRRAEPGSAPHAGHGTTSPRAPASGAQPSHAGHEGHSAAAPRAPASGAQPPAAGHAGHAPSAGAMPAVPPAPVAVPVSPEQAARTLRPDALDAPAATSLVDAQRSAEMAREMSSGGHGGHGGHGAGTYRQVDAGRGPGAHEGSEPQTPGAGPQQHDHGSSRSAVHYVCPMHPEITSETPGTCPICGMTLVERRKE